MYPLQVIPRSFITISLLLSLILSACGSSGQESAAPSTGDVPASTAITLDSGYICPAPITPAEVTSKELNLFVWAEYFPDELIECFELTYNVDVNRDEYSSNEELYAKLSASNTSYDLIQPTDYIVALMIKKGMLQKLDKSKLTILNNFNAAYMNQEFDPGNEYTLPYQAGTYAIVVNTEKVQNIPTSWEDLWKPEYAGRMVFLDDMRATIGLTLITLGYDINTTDEKQLEEAKAKLALLVPGIKLFDSDSPKTALIAGDVDLGMTWTGEAVLAQRDNPNIQYIYPKEGAIVWQDNYAIPSGGQHSDAVYAWLNYTLQGDIFWLMLRDFPYNNPNQAALDFAKTNQSEVYTAYMDSTITNPPSEILEKGYQIKDVGESAPAYDRIWTEVKGQ